MGEEAYLDTAIGRYSPEVAATARAGLKKLRARFPGARQLVYERRQSLPIGFAPAERGSAVRAELQRLGVGKIDLAFRAVQDGIVRTEDGRLVARGEAGETSLKEYLTAFVNENPEFLPARIAGGTGMTAALKAPAAGRETVDLERIRPGMSAEEMQRVREEIVRVASQTLKGM